VRKRLSKMEDFSRLFTIYNFTKNTMGKENEENKGKELEILFRFLCLFSVCF